MLERVGRFRVQELVGKGAMADVYRAFDPNINRTLAIKILKSEFRQNREYAGRFLREAKAAGALNHPNIVTVYDVGQVDGYPYIAMELIEGRTLNDVVRERGKLSAREVVGVGVQLADALRYAHAMNVVHRDIKPSNIMLLPDGASIKILDFGIAHMRDVEGDEENDDGLKTQIGQVLGSPRYMSPEQALGRDLDGRSDLFSVGVVLYELTTGRKAFSGVSPATLAIQITQQEPPSLADVVSDAPRGLQFIINKLLAKRPERRFRDGQQLAEALRREQAAINAVQAEAQTRRRYLPLQVRTTLLVGSITALALGLSTGTVLVRQQASMQKLAVTFGSATAAFVANNAALRAADNATLPPAQQDWLPTQAFVENAASDPNVQQLTVVDGQGVVRGSKTPGLIGARYRPPRAEQTVGGVGGDVVTETADGAGLRFVHPIVYAGRDYGRVDLVLSRAGLRSVTDLSRLMMGILALVTLGSVGLASYIVARSLAAPIRRLKEALTDAAAGDLDFRISHHRKDEFGELFDAYNLMSSNLEEQMAATEGYALEGERSVPAPASHAFVDEEEPQPFRSPFAPEARAPDGDLVDAVYGRRRMADADASRAARSFSPFDPPPSATPSPHPGPEDDERTVIGPRDL